jgi:hypothetical protein
MNGIQVPTELVQYCEKKARIHDIAVEPEDETQSHKLQTQKYKMSTVPHTADKQV